MTVSTIISIVSTFFAVISVLVSLRSYYINTTDRRLKENPFFIIEAESFNSNYPSDRAINPIAYNFIKASNDKERLNELKESSFKNYKKYISLSISDKTYLKLYNAGGIGKNLKIETHVVVPEHQLKKEKQVVNGWEVKFEGENEDEFGDFSIFTTYNDNENMKRIYFYSDVIFESKFKGIKADGYLKIWIPKEFILFTNLYIAGLVDDPPYIKFNIKGDNTYDKSFTDEVTLIIERYKTKEGSSSNEISIDIGGI